MSTLRSKPRQRLSMPIFGHLTMQSALYVMYSTCWAVPSYKHPAENCVTMVRDSFRRKTNRRISFALQEQGWCHGDISADNIVMSTPDDQLTFTLIDFGFTTRLGDNFVCRTTNLFTGASSALQDNLACTVNDIESLMYVLMELAGLKLPWHTGASFGLSFSRNYVSPSLLATLVQNKNKASVSAYVA